MILFSLKNSRCSSNNSNVILRYSVITAVVMLILSFALKTAGQMFYLLIAVFLLGLGTYFSIRIKNFGVLIGAVLISLFCFRVISELAFSVYSSYKFEGTRDSIVAVVAETPQRYGENSDTGTCTVIIDDSERKLIQKGKRILLSGHGVSNLSLGDKVTCEVALDSFKDHDDRFSFYSDNVFVMAKPVKPIVAGGKSKSIYSLSFWVREYAFDTFSDNTHNFGMLLAILTGERSYIGENLYEMVKTAGVSHILVVSGMHFTVLCGLVLKLLSLFKMREFFKDSILLLFIFFMMCVCGFSMSILRAAVVYVVAVFYRRLNRLGDGIVSFCNAVIVVLFIHPFAVFSLSFLLSFSSAFGITVLSKKLVNLVEKKFELNKASRFIVETTSVSVSAYIATLPVVIFYFGSTSTYAVFSNILIAPVSNLIMIFSMMGVILNFIPYVGRLILTIADLLADYFIYVVNLADKLPLNTVQVRYGKLLSFLIIAMLSAIYIIKAKPYLILKKKR